MNMQKRLIIYVFLDGGEGYETKYLRENLKQHHWE